MASFKLPEHDVPLFVWPSLAAGYVRMISLELLLAKGTFQISGESGVDSVDVSFR